MVLEHVIVPIDLSPASLAALPVAASLAQRTGGRVDALAVVGDVALVHPTATELAFNISRLGLPVTIHREVEVHPSPAEAIVAKLDRTPGGALVMRSQGRGRSAAVLGSTLAEVLRRSHRPVIVLGPHADLGPCELDGEYFVPLDGSANGEAVLPIVAAWARQFGGTPTVVEVATSTYADSAASAYLRTQAAALTARVGRPVDYELIHGGDVGLAIAEQATAAGAAMVFLATHGRTGIGRLASGSVAAAVVRHARMPVVVYRPAQTGDLVDLPHTPVELATAAGQ